MTSIYTPAPRDSHCLYTTLLPCMLKKAACDLNRCHFYSARRAPRTAPLSGVRARSLPS